MRATFFYDKIQTNKSQPEQQDRTRFHAIARGCSENCTDRRRDSQAQRKLNRVSRSERNRNYILRRQQVIPGLGTPTTRVIYGKREIDVYRNGLMFERDNMVGVREGARRTSTTKSHLCALWFER